MALGRVLSLPRYGFVTVAVTVFMTMDIAGACGGLG